MQNFNYKKDLIHGVKNSMITYNDTQILTTISNQSSTTTLQFHLAPHINKPLTTEQIRLLELLTRVYQPTLKDRHQAQINCEILALGSNDDLIIAVQITLNDLLDVELLTINLATGIYVTIDKNSNIVDLATIEATSLSIENLSDLLLASQNKISQQFEWQSALVNTQNIDDSNQPEIVIATKNKGKAQEFNAIFGARGYKVKTLLDFPEIPDVEETGTTFESNARLKAETISILLKRPVLADDSGLCVDYLGGLPGVYSARYAEDHNDAANNAKLMSELAGVPNTERQAHFHCTLAFAAPNRETLIVDGEVKGQIASVPRGDNGFGYDPLFYLTEFNKTMAELPATEKNKISHRARAVTKLNTVWEAWLKGDE